MKIVEEEKEKEPFEVMLQRYEKSLDGKFKKVIEDKFSRLENTLTTQITDEMRQLKDSLNKK